MASLDSLPTEVLFNICSFLKPNEVSNLCRVNREFYAMRFDVLKSVDHLNVHKLTSTEAQRYILRYKKITNLDISGSAFRRIFRRDDRGKLFAEKLATSCPKIDSFTVSGVDGIHVVMLYIISRSEKLVVKDGSLRAAIGIKNLHVYPRNINTRGDFLRLSQRLRDVVDVSTDFNCLAIDHMAETIADGTGKHQIVECWTVVGNRIKGLIADQVRYGRLLRAILPSLQNLTDLRLSALSGNSMDIITTNNPGLKSFTSGLTLSGFHYIQRLTQLEHLKIVVGVNQFIQLPQNQIDDVLDVVGGSLLTIDLKLNEWNGSFMAISEKCNNLRSVKLTVKYMKDSDLEEFRGSFGDDVDVSVERIQTLF